MTCEPDPRWLPATKGRSTISTLSRHLFDMQPRPEATDYWHAATELVRRQRRRAMVILVTNVRDEDSQDLQKAIGLLRQRHLLVVASLTENAISDTLEKPVTTSTTLYILRQHKTTSPDAVPHKTKISRRGVFMHDTDCESLPGVLTDQYMAIKRAGIL